MSDSDNEWVRGLAVVVPGLFAYLVVAFVLSASAEKRNAPQLTDKDVWARLDFGPDTKRQDEVLLHKATFLYRCEECHEAGEARDPRPREFIGEHAKMNLEHGMVDTCFTCHHETEINAFKTRSGDPMPYNEHVALCAGCHGPIYRDWKHGAHGRRSGFFDRSKGDLRRAECIVCHDPHKPAFAPMKPLPPPGVAVGEPPKHDPHFSTVVQKILQEVPEAQPAARAEVPEEEKQRERLK